MGIVGTMFYTAKRHLPTKQDLYYSEHRINKRIEATEDRISKNLMTLHSRTCGRLDSLEVRMEQSMNSNLKCLEDMMEERIVDNYLKDLKDMMEKTLSVSQAN